VQGVSYGSFEGSTLSGLSSTFHGAILHEMSHGFGLPHDARNDANFHGNVMGNGLRGFRGAVFPDTYPDDDTYLSYGDALALSTSRYFNREAAAETAPPTLNVSTSGDVAPVDGLLQVSFSAADESGLAAAWLLKNGELIGEMPLSGGSVSTAFATPYYDAGEAATFSVAAFDIYGNRSTSAVSITPATGQNRAPRPFIRLSSSSPHAGAPVELDASGSVDPDGDALTVEWDLDGDGVFDTPPSASLTLATTFETAGVRMIGARLTDASGARALSSPIGVRVVGEVQAPTMAVSQGSTVLTSGQSAAIDFGSVARGDTPPSVTFTVRNAGEQTLELSAPELPEGYAAGPDTLASTLASVKRKR
jgi:hypothetical protein